MARKAPTRRRPARPNQQINKAISPNLMQSIQQAPRGLEPRRYGLMDAINAATAAQNVGWWDLRPMPRDPLDDSAFGPNQPLLPQPIDPVRPDTGRPEPRVWEYPTSWNLPGNSRREVPWQVLRASSTGVDIIRRCIEARKKHVRTLRWAWTVRADVVEDAYNRDTKSGYEDVAQRLREEHSAEIRRLTEFWREPWRCAPGGPWGFGQWINSLMEEHLTIDAIAIYPRLTVGGDLFALEQVDGSTIKPLLDWRGSQPLPPHPAYQQELYGFPRGEYAATVTVDAGGNELVENGYLSDELFYYRENARLFSPYGFSAVEQSLISARLYLKRQGWMLAEYDDGSTPLMFLEPPADPALSADFTPAKRRMWEESFNGEYSGQTAARHRAKVLPPGWQPHQPKQLDEQFKPDYDLHLIKLVAGHFGMTATELGFSENQGLGSAGWQEGQAEVQGRVGLKPDVEVLSDIINAISTRFLHNPPELEFTFLDPASQNDAESDQVADSQMKRATITINDDRRRLKLPPFDFAEADMPMLVGVGTAGYVFVDGAKAAADKAAEAQQAQAQAQMDGTAGKLEVEHRKLDDAAAAREEDRGFARESREAEAEVTKAARPDGAHTGAMVALVPTAADAARLAVDGGEPADQLHLTLRYLGKAADFHDQARQHLIENVREYFKGLPAYAAEAFNVAVFNPGGDDPCIVLGVGGEDIYRAHRKVEVAIEDYGADLPEPHTPFVAHITLVYTDDASRVEELLDRVGPIGFDRVRVAFGGDVTDIPLGDRAAAEKAVSAELHAFRTWRRRNPGTPRRPFMFKAATPKDLDSPPGPDVVAFGEGWEWIEDLEKYESWWPRDSRGRWVKRSHLGGGPLLDALRDLDRPSQHLTDTDIRTLDDNQLFDFFHAMSRRRELDEPLMHRLVEDMDRRERQTPFQGLADEELTDEQRRVDELVAGGRDYLSAYAEVHSEDEARLAAQEAASGVDRRAGETLQQAVRRSYDEWLHMSYLQAEKATRGSMLNRAGKKAGVDPLTLFTGPVSRARRYASEDLMRWWRQNQRMNLTQFRAQVLRRERDVAAARVTVAQSTGRDYL